MGLVKRERGRANYREMERERRGKELKEGRNRDI